MDIYSTCADGVLSVVLDRPARKNALTNDMYQAMADVLAAAEVDDKVRALLIRSAGDTFCAGNDIEDFLGAPPLTDDAPVVRFLRLLSQAEKPIVAAVAGAAVGIGTTLLMHCDLVYAAPDARFMLPFVRLGLCPEAASSLLLPQIAGYHRAAEKLLMGEAFGAQEALDMGLVNRLLSGEQLQEFALGQALKLAALPPESLRLSKALLKSGNTAQVAARMQSEAGHFRRMLASPEAQAAFKAFLAR
jgi:enoyl-CoA hydratase/carnithine racemase